MSILDALFNPNTNMRLLVGVSENLDPDGSLRIYVGARYTGIHTHTAEPEDIEKIRRAWSGARGHQFIEVRTENLCNCPEPEGNAA
jgi:hypothetical protein